MLVTSASSRRATVPALRPLQPLPIGSWEVAADDVVAVQRHHHTHVVLDTPAGLYGSCLR